MNPWPQSCKAVRDWESGPPEVSIQRVWEVLSDATDERMALIRATSRPQAHAKACEMYGEEGWRLVEIEEGEA
jgi:hypothetical protein